MRALMVFVAMALPAFGQDMEAKLAEKLAEPFLKKAAWITDYDKAREESKKSGKFIFAFFTRSYAA